MLLYCTLLFSTVLLELIKIKKSLLKYNAVESIEELKNTIKISILICAREYKLYEHPIAHLKFPQPPSRMVHNALWVDDIS